MSDPLHAETLALLEEAEQRGQSGRIEEGLELSLAAAAAAIRALGETSPLLGQCCLTSGRMRVAMGDTNGGRRDLAAALALLGPDTQEPWLHAQADALWYYGDFMVGLGALEEGQHYLLLGRDAYERLEGPNYPMVGICLKRLAEAAETWGLPDEAEQFAREALNSLSRRPESLLVQLQLTRLAFERAVAVDDLKVAKKTIAESKSILKRIRTWGGLEPHEFTELELGIAWKYAALKKYREVDRILSRILNDSRKPGALVPGGIIWLLAEARVALGDPVEGLSHLRNLVTDSYESRAIVYGTTGDRKTAIRSMYTDLYRFVDHVLIANRQGDASVAAEAFDMVLRTKGINGEVESVRRAAIAASDDVRLQQLWQRLSDLKVRIAELGLARSDVPAELQEDLRVAEFNFADALNGLEFEELSAFNHQGVSEALPDDSVLVEYLVFPRIVRGRIEGELPWGCVAFVVQPRSGAPVTMFDLGPAEEIGSQVQQFRASLAADRGNAQTESVRGVGMGVRVEQTPDRVGATLRARLIDSIRSAIGSAGHLVIAPDRIIHRIPFEALPDASGGCLIDEFDVSYLNVGRELSRFSIDAAPSTRPLVFADPDYDKTDGPTLPTDLGPPNSLSSESIQLTRGAHNVLRREMERDGIEFARLPGTEAEGIAVAELLGVEPFLGESATEKRLKEARSPVVLHLATHGFFLPESDVGEAAEGALARSGVAMAGANAWRRGELLDGDDAILNGEDVAQMDLQGTLLVVLSACETGTGEEEIGSGVVGLRQAFASAGARTLLMSLWEVPDEQTRMLMTHFYESLIRGSSRAAALRDAQQRVRAVYPDPYYWAAFICHGDPRPIPESRLRLLVDPPD